jgi:Flp pilus assembly protein protease CpaA
MLGDYKFFTFTVVLIAAEQVLVFLLKVLRVLLNRLALNIKGLNLNSLEKGIFVEQS